jgi:Intracellular proteinase inhibitor
MPFRRLAAAAAALVLAACAPAASGAGAPASPGDEADPTLISSLSVQTLADTVRLTLQVTNVAESPVRLAFPSGQTYDFSIVRAGETLWHWSADKSFVAMMRDETLAAGETRTWSEAWVAGPAARGDLIARGWLTATSHRVERAAVFTLR